MSWILVLNDPLLICFDHGTEEWRDEFQMKEGIFINSDSFWILFPVELELDECTCILWELNLSFLLELWACHYFVVKGRVHKDISDLLVLNCLFEVGKDVYFIILFIEFVTNDQVNVGVAGCYHQVIGTFIFI